MIDRKYLLIICLLLTFSMAQSVEILVQVKGDRPSWDTTIVEMDEGVFDTTIDVNHGKGSIVDIKEDGASWGRKTTPPVYVILRVPNVTIAQAQPYYSKQLKSVVFDSLKALWQADIINLEPDTIVHNSDTTIINCFITIPKSKILNYLNNAGDE